MPRATTETAVIRNKVVAALADRVFVSYASGASKTEALCRRVLEWGKLLLTFDSSENNSLIALGATPCGNTTLVAQECVRKAEAAIHSPTLIRGPAVERGLLVSEASGRIIRIKGE